MQQQEHNMSLCIWIQVRNPTIILHWVSRYSVRSWFEVCVFFSSSLSFSFVVYDIRFWEIGWVCRQNFALKRMPYGTMSWIKFGYCYVCVCVRMSLCVVQQCQLIDYRKYVLVWRKFSQVSQNHNHLIKSQITNGRHRLIWSKYVTFFGCVFFPLPSSNTCTEQYLMKVQKISFVGVSRIWKKKAEWERENNFSRNKNKK